MERDRQHIAGTCPEAARILAGELDRHLRHIEVAIEQRRKEWAEELGLRPGVRVMFTETCPEKHLRGKVERVREVTGRTFQAGEVSVLLEWVMRDHVAVMP
jgi:hypothetical protein